MMVRAFKADEAPATFAPECATVSLSELDAGPRRLDAEVYLSEGYTARAALERSGLSLSPLSELASIWQPGRLKGIQVSRDDGMPYLAATQIFDIWPTPRKWLAPGKTRNLSQLLVEPGCILVTRSGTVGNPIIAYAPHEDRIISDDLLRVELDAPMRHYVYAFLRTWYGRAMMRASQYGNVIKHLEVGHLAEIPVPAMAGMIEGVSTEIQGIFEKRDMAYGLDAHAQEMLSDALPGVRTPPPEVGFSVYASRLSSGRRRVDGYAHTPPALAVSRVVEAGPHVQLAHVANLILPSRFTRTYTAKGTPLFGSEDIFKINPEITKFLAPAMSIDLAEYTVEAGWILMARSGQIYGINGSTVLATEWHEAGAISEHVIRIVPNDEVRSGYLQAVLSHPEYGQPLILSRAFGTSIPELAPEDIAEIPIPRLDQKLENDIADAVEEASRLRMEADKSENGIVAKLEDAIDEKVGKLRPDANETAFRVMLEATGQAPKTVPPHLRGEDDRNQEAVTRGKKGGRPKREASGS